MVRMKGMMKVVEEWKMVKVIDGEEVREGGDMCGIKVVKEDEVGEWKVVGK